MNILLKFSAHKSMKNLSKKDFTQFFVDSTYKCVPNNTKNINVYYSNRI